MRHPLKPDLNSRPVMAQTVFGRVLGRGRWLCLLLALSGWISTLGAADGFQLIKGFEEIAERGKVPSYIILTESNRFSFLPPPGWNLSHNAVERKVTMVSQDLGASMSFSFLPPDALTGPAPTMADLKAQLKVRFPEAKFVRDFPCFSGGQPGFGFDLERVINKKLPISMRVATVPFSGGKVEFVLTSASASFSKYHRTFGILLSSFQIEGSSLTSPPKK
jgi:hypothetical protein